MREKAWLDITVIRCPVCGRYYAEASWYAIELGADIECGECGTEFNSKKHVTDRLMLEFQISKEGKIQETEIAEHISL
jgi:hypothetical protein